MISNKLIISLCTIFAVLAAGPASIAHAAPSKPATRVVPPVPSGFVLGKTTLAEAEAVWEADKSVIVGRAHAAIGAGSGLDKTSKLAADKIDLVDIQSVEFEGPRPARFAFFEGVLFSVQSVLKPFIQLKTAPVPELSDEQLHALEQALRQQYGPPSQALRDFAAGKKPDVLVWNYGGDTLTISINAFNGSRLLYTNGARAKLAEKYKTKLCRSIPGC